MNKSRRFTPGDCVITGNDVVLTVVAVMPDRKRIVVLWNNGLATQSMRWARFMFNCHPVVFQSRMCPPPVDGPQVMT